jgi:hypothetical protein
MLKKLSSNSTKIVVLLATYSFLYYFPWAVINVTEGFRDFEGYVARFETLQYHDFIFSYLPSKERFWDYIIIVNSSLVSDARVALSIISIMILLLWFRISYRYLSNSYSSLVLIISPPVIDVAFSGIRNGLSWALLFYILFVLRARARYILCIFPVYIHVTSLIPILFYVILVPFLKGTHNGRLLIFSCLFFPGLIIASVSIYGFVNIMDFMDDGRDIAYLQRGSGFNKVSFWIILFFLFHKSYYKIWSIEVLRPIAIVAFNLISFTIVVSFFIPWSERIIGVSSILLVPLVANFNKLDRLLFLSLFFVWNMVLFSYWTPIMSFFK